MVINPYNTYSAKSPFIYRQFTTSIAHLLYKNNIYYDAKISFDTDIVTQRVFFSLLLSNYIGLFMCFLSIIYFLRLYIRDHSIIFYLFPIFLISSTFGYLFNGLSVLTEGWTYFFNTIIFILILERKIYWILFILILSLINKEITSIAICVFSFSNLIHNFKSKFIDWFYVKVFMMSILCFTIYITVRLLLIPIEGGDNQTEIEQIFLNIKSLNFSSTFFKQSLLSLGALIILLFFIGIKNRFESILKDRMTFSILLTVLIIFIIGCMAGIGNNIGRIISSISPIIIIICLKHIDEEYEKNLPI
jgi:hypothetical protein